MYNYEMDPVSWRYTADMIPSTDGQTDGQGHTTVFNFVKANTHTYLCYSYHVPSLWIYSTL